MSELPKSWLAIKLSEDVNYKKGKKPKLLFVENENNNLAPYIDIKAFEKGIIRKYAHPDDGVRAISDETLMVWDGARSGLVGNGIKGVIGSTLMRIKPIVSNKKYFHFFLESQYGNINSRTKGMGIPHVDPVVLWNIPYPLAPLNEQIRIANKLDSLLGKLEATQKRLDKIPTLLKRFRQSVLAAAVSGKLTQQWREEHNLTTADMLKGFAPLKKPARYKSRNLGYIQGVLATSVGKPKYSLVKNWQWVPLVDIAAMGTGHTPSRSKTEYWGGDKCWIGIKDARNNHSGTIFDTAQKTNDLGLANSAARILPINTVCISRTASIGYVVKMGVPMSTSQDFVTWTPTKVLSSDWLKWLFVSEKESLFRFGRGSTHTTVYFPEWLSMHVALPPIEEQEEIVRRVESLFNLADKVEQQYQTAKQRTDKLTQSILAKAFRGELVPQDPNDEPASELLKRIKESRA